MLPTNELKFINLHKINILRTKAANRLTVYTDYANYKIR